MTTSEHGKRGTYTKGCRCDACREANRSYIESRRRAAGVQPARLGPQSEHGTPGRYKRGCRCEACRAGEAARTRRRVEINRRRIVDNPTLAKHGSYSTYVNWGCRCDPCRAAGAVHNAARADRQKVPA